MWEVIWTDPTRESVGERRARKEMERDQRQGRRRLDRAASSAKSSSSGERSFSFLGSRSSKRVTSQSADVPPVELPATPLNYSKSVRSSVSSSVKPTSADSEDSESTVRPITVPVTAPPPPDLMLSPLSYESGGTSPLSARDSVFSKWTEPTSMHRISLTGSSSKSWAEKTMGPASFISQSTQITVVSRTPETSLRGAAADVKISAEGARNNPPTPPLSPEKAPISTFVAHDTPVRLVSNARSPLVPTSPDWISSFQPNNPDAWKPPHTWNGNLSPPETWAIPHHEIEGAPHPAPPSPDAVRRLEEMQQDLRRMAKTTPQKILDRLNEIWRICADTNGDTWTRRRLETEQTYWMLFVLAHLDPVVEQNPSNPPAAKTKQVDAQRVLALYESQARTSYLAGIHYNQDMYHLSAAPLSSNTFPNIRPLSVPTISPATYPKAPGAFGSVYCLALPAICPSQEIPEILGSIHQSLTAGGSFHLTIIDPMPAPATLGPCMRAWLESHLIFNLERGFRCVNPSKLFPAWLGDACLRGEGSTITTARFVAVAATTSHSGSRLDAPPLDRDPAGQEQMARSELRTLVGRMLWVEVWGQYVDAAHWWWDDPACVEECQLMGTYWEYSHIEAVKEERVM